MNHKRMHIFHPTTSKSGIFLLELIIVILFFSIASTVCIEMFVKSYTRSNESTYLNKSIQISENIAESFKMNNESFDESSSTSYYYDKNGTVVSEENYTYFAIVHFSENELIKTAEIEVYMEDSFIYSLQVDKYISERSSENEE